MRKLARVVRMSARSVRYRFCRSVWVPLEGEGREGLSVGLVERNGLVGGSVNDWGECRADVRGEQATRSTALHSDGATKTISSRAGREAGGRCRSVCRCTRHVSTTRTAVTTAAIMTSKRTESAMRQRFAHFISARRTDWTCSCFSAPASVSSVRCDARKGAMRKKAPTTQSGGNTAMTRMSAGCGA